MYIILSKNANSKSLPKVAQSRSYHSSILKSRVEELFSNKYVVKVEGERELRISVPQISVAFEFLDRTHYIDTWYATRNLQETKELDEKKRLKAKEEGITLIEIPFWWNGQLDSLVATIRKNRNDLLKDFPTDSDDVILQELSVLVQADKVKVPTATFYTPLKKIKGWYLFEKYDGIRGLWDPVRKRFLSRYGNVLQFPEHVIQQMPTDIAIDGEIWFGRGNFYETVKITHKSVASTIDWSKFSYMVFDTPSYRHLKYSDRLEALQKHLPKDHPFIKISTYITCESHQQVNDIANSIIQGGGEGIILRDPNELYVEGKSTSILKFKVYRDDEARVLERIGLNRWRLEMAAGYKFEAPLENFQAGEPKEGDIVTFKYTKFNHTVNLPISPVITRIREDITWEDVVNKLATKKRKLFPSKKNNNYKKLERLPLGYWSSDKNCRNFLQSVMAHKNLNNTDPNDWYKLTRKDILDKKGSGLLHRYAGSLSEAIIQSFPEISFDRDKFEINKDWSIIENCKSFFNQFAKQHNFDPLVANNWYSVQTSDITKVKGGSGLLVHYNRSLYSALSAAFPNLSLDESRFKNIKREKVDPKQFFDEFARVSGFDPTNPDNWYSVTNSSIIAKGGKQILNRYRRSLKEALLSAYPTIGLKPHFFNKASNSFELQRKNDQPVHPDISLYTREIAKS